MGRRASISGDRVFSLIVIALVSLGIAMFVSASLGLLAGSDTSPLRLAFTQIALGLIPGVLVLCVLRFLPLSWLSRLALPAYALTVLFTACVFIPGLGETYNGATRWIQLGFTTIQPSEFMKLGVIVFLAAYLSRRKDQVRDFVHGLLPFLLIVGIPIIILLLQPNTSTALVIGATALAMYILAGASLRDVGIIMLVGIIGLALLVLSRPYLLERVQTFVDPSHNPLTSGYQIQQSLIAIGSGGIVGRGFGQSAQKFNYLPEAQGDSVFAVLGEELGFLGTVLSVLLFLAFAARGFIIGSEANTMFAALLGTGLTLLITLSAFLNIGAMVGILPLTGLPLPFISHGGTALLTSLAAVGIILNIAAHRGTRKAHG